MEMLRGIIKRFALKSILTVFTGTFLAQIINGLSLLILARFFYDPDSVGEAAIYLSIYSFFSIIPTLRFTHGIQIAGNDEESRKLVDLCFFINCCVSAILLISLLIFGRFFLHILNIQSLGYNILVLPLHIFLYGINETLLTYSNRLNKFRLVAFNRLLNALIAFFVALGFGYQFAGNSFGLIISPIAALLVSNIFLFKRLWWKHSINFFRYDLYIPIIKRFKKFAILGLPSDLLNAFTNQMPVYMMSVLAFNVKEIGNFNMSNRLLGMPISLIGIAVGEVFRQRAIIEKREVGKYIQAFKNTFILLFSVAIIPSLLIMLFGKQIFVFFLGEEWANAGIYSQILGFLYFMRLICSPLSYSFYISEKQGEHLLLNIYLLISTALLFFIFYTYGVIMVLSLFAINYSAIYVVYFFRSYQLSRS